MRKIPQHVERQLTELGLFFTERQALFIYADGGMSPPSFVRDLISRRIGADKFSRAWAFLTSDRLSLGVAQSNLRVQTENFPAAPLRLSATTPTFRVRGTKRGKDALAAMVGCVV